MNHSITHSQHELDLNIVCHSECNHSNCLQIAFNQIQDKLSSFPHVVFRSIKVGFTKLPHNLNHSRLNSLISCSNSSTSLQNSNLENYHYSSHSSNFKTQDNKYKTNPYDREKYHSTQNINIRDGDKLIHNLHTHSHGVEHHRISTDSISPENIYQLNEPNINKLSLEETKAYLVKAVQMLKKSPTPNSSDRFTSTLKPNSPLIPLNRGSPIPQPHDVLNWLSKQNSTPVRPSLQRSDTDSSLSSYHIVSQSPISPSTGRDTYKRSASQLTPIMMTIPSKHPHCSSRDATSDSSQAGAMAPSTRRPPMSPSLLRRHAGAVDETKYVESEWDQHLQIIKDQEEAYETVTESPASSPKLNANEHDKDYDSASTTSLENPIADFQAMVQNQ